MCDGPNRASSANDAAQAPGLADAHGAHDLEELVPPGAHQVEQALGAPVEVEIVQLDGTLVAGLRVPAEAALQRNEQRAIDGDGVRAADDGLGHVLREGDAAGEDEVDGLPDAGLDELQVDLTDEVFQMARPGGVQLQAVAVRPEVDGIHPGLRQAERPVGGGCVERHPDGKGDVSPLRGRIATLAAACSPSTPEPAQPTTTPAPAATTEQQADGSRETPWTITYSDGAANQYTFTQAAPGGEVAFESFSDEPHLRHSLHVLREVGLGYLRLGQPATELSGGEAQRIKLATELQRAQRGNALYVLDEPTTGLHFEDIRKLLTVLSRLVDQGNTVLVIEHNLDVIKTADWILALGPEGGDGGGRIVAPGTPEEVAATEGSHTGRFLAPLLASQATPVKKRKPA